MVVGIDVFNVTGAVMKNDPSFKKLSVMARFGLIGATDNKL